MAEAGPSGSYLPYARHSVVGQDREAVGRVLASDWLAQGPEVDRFEADLGRVVARRHAVVVSSGTTALEIALAALDVRTGDEVIVPSLTFVATANAVLRRGAVPRFVDIDPETLMLDPTQVEQVAGGRTAGAILVHYGGHLGDVSRLRDVLGADRFVLEDACHALGARRDGRPAGSLGDAACFSFHPAKAITTGEGGALVTDDPRVAACARRLREHGIERNPSQRRGLGLPHELAPEEQGDWVYEQHHLASNGRLAEPAAALGRSQLAGLSGRIQRRTEIAAHYCSAFRDLDLLELPPVEAGVESAWHLFPIRLRIEALSGGRARVFDALRGRGLGVQVHYIPVHLQPYYRRLFGTRWGDLPATEDAYLRLLSLPLFPSMCDRDVERVVSVTREELERARR